METLILPIVSLLLSILLIIVYYSKKRIKNEETNVYSKMLIINLLYSIFAIVIYLYSKGEVANVLIIGMLQKLYMILMLLLILCMVVYNFKILYINSKTKTKNKFILFSAFLTIICGVLILVLPLKVINKKEIIDAEGLSYDVLILA